MKRLFPDRALSSLARDDAREGDRFREFSPAHNISNDDPPAIVFLGSADALVPVSTAEAFLTKMKQAGNAGELMIFDGKPHGFFKQDWQL